MGKKNKNSAKRAMIYLIIPACGFFLAAVIAFFSGYTIPGVCLIVIGLFISLLAIRVKQNDDKKKYKDHSPVNKQ